jgi:hypothetical protein
MPQPSSGFLAQAPSGFYGECVSPAAVVSTRLECAVAANLVGFDSGGESCRSGGFLVKIDCGIRVCGELDPTTEPQGFVDLGSIVRCTPFRTTLNTIRKIPGKMPPISTLMALKLLSRRLE